MLVNGLPTGAPSAACSTITPDHFFSAATSPVPFTVDLSSIPHRHYVPGQSYNSKMLLYDQFNKLFELAILYLFVVILQSPSGQDFRGFLIQGRVRANESPVGTFGSGTGYQSRCSGNVSFCSVDSLLCLRYIECCHSYK